MSDTSIVHLVTLLLLTTTHSAFAAEKQSPTNRNLASNSYCGCDACTNKILNTRAGQYKCKERIEFKESWEGGILSRADACAFVANEWPDVCGPCACAATPVSTPAPTDSPSSSPTTGSPTSSPTDSPTSPPTKSPTAAPTDSPTSSPTKNPTEESSTPAPPTKSPTNAPTTSTPTKTPTPPPIAPPLYCGCYDCTQQFWDTLAGAHTCGDRITWKESSEGGSLSHLDACAFVSNEFPSICGPACDPSNCDKNDDDDPPSSAPPNSLSLTDSLYCFPEYAQRTRFENVFNDTTTTNGNTFVMEVKHEPTGQTCGPGNNYFTSDTVSYDYTTQELTLEYKKIGTKWTGAEVRILRSPSTKYNGITFPHGTFSFSIKSISVLDDDQSNTVLSTKLPSDMVLGMFTWDTKEDYSTHENWNHEVDIEISQWGDPNNADVQFLTQPWDAPGPHFTPRFFSGGTSGVYDQGGHIYEFTWDPNEIIWYTDAAGGTSRVYSTTIAQDAGAIDYIQCLPSNTEVRINLWNFETGNDGLRPNGLVSDSHRVVVVIDNFTFVESMQTHVVDGAACSKDCQCLEDTSECSASGICVPITS